MTPFHRKRLRPLAASRRRFRADGNRPPSTPPDQAPVTRPRAHGSVGVLVLIARGGAASDAGSLITPIAIGMVLLSVALLFDGLLRAAGRAGLSGLASVAQGVSALVAGAALLGIGLGPRAGALAY